jgi:hypothetical protein
VSVTLDPHSQVDWSDGASCVLLAHAGILALHRLGESEVSGSPLARLVPTHTLPMLAAASLTVTAHAERGDQNGGAENVSGKINWWRRRCVVAGGSWALLGRCGG